MLTLAKRYITWSMYVCMAVLTENFENMDFSASNLTQRFWLYYVRHYLDAQEILRCKSGRKLPPRGRDVWLCYKAKKCTIFGKLGRYGSLNGHKYHTKKVMYINIHLKL